MKVVVAPGAFKGCLAAPRVAEAMARGVKAADPGARVAVVPMADGGEGTADCLVGVTGGYRVRAVVHDPLMRPVQAVYGVYGDRTTAIIEIAAASGLARLDPAERDHYHENTSGTGELILHAVERGIKRIVLGLGGYPAADAGMGLARALGIRFLNADGAEVGLGPGGLGNVALIDSERLDPRMEDVQIIGLYEAGIPFSQGNERSIFGPGKALMPVPRVVVDNVAMLGELIEERQGRSILSMPGTGIAGACGLSLAGLLGADLEPGIDFVIEATGLKAELATADLVLTGEGRIGGDGGGGQVSAGVARVAARYGVPAIAIGGTIVGTGGRIADNGLLGTFSILERPMDMQEAIREAIPLLERAAERIIRVFAAGKQHG